MPRVYGTTDCNGEYITAREIAAAAKRIGLSRGAIHIRIREKRWPKAYALHAKKGLALSVLRKGYRDIEGNYITRLGEVITPAEVEQSPVSEKLVNERARQRKDWTKEQILGYVAPPTQKIEMNARERKRHAKATKAIISVISPQFPETPEGKLMVAIIGQAILDYGGESKANRIEAGGYLLGDIPHAAACGVRPEWIRRVIKEAGIDLCATA